MHTRAELAVVAVTDEYPPDPGGVARSLGRIVDGVAGRGVSVDVVVLDDAQPASYSQPLPGVHRFGVGPEGDRRRERDAERAARTLAWARGRQADLVHAFFPSRTGATAALLASVGLRVPWIASFRGNDLHHGLFGRSLATVRMALDQADAVTFVSDELRAWAGAASFDRGNRYVIRNAVAGPTAEPLSRGCVGAEATSDMPFVAPVLATTGALRAKKGADAYLSALEALGDRAQGLLIGGLLRREVSRWDDRARALESAGRLVRTGFVAPEAVPGHLAGADIYVQPSLYDGCPNAVLEAAAAGLPIVCSRIPAHEELLTDGIEALMHAPEDVAGLVATLWSLLANPSLARTLGEAARARVVREHGLAAEAERWRRLYDSVLATHERPLRATGER